MRSALRLRRAAVACCGRRWYRCFGRSREARRAIISTIAIAPDPGKDIDVKRQNSSRWPQARCSQGDAPRTCSSPASCRGSVSCFPGCRRRLRFAPEPRSKGCSNSAMPRAHDRDRMEMGGGQGQWLPGLRPSSASATSTSSSRVERRPPGARPPPHHPDRHGDRRRSGRRGSGGQLGAAGRECHRVDIVAPDLSGNDSSCSRKSSPSVAGGGVAPCRNPSRNSN